MKTYLPYIVYLMLTLTAIYYYLENQKNLEIIASQDSALTELNAEVEYRTTKEGRIIAQKDAAVMASQEIAKAYPAVVEQLKKDFDVKVREMKAYMRSEFEARGSGNSIVHNHYITDSTGRQVPAWELKASDGHLDFRATVIDSLHAPYTYTYADTITTVISIRKKWFLGDEHPQAQTMFANKNAKAIHTTNILDKGVRDKRCVISAGAAYIPFDNKVMPYVGIGYAIVKF